MNTVQVRDITFGDGTLVLIAGPCVIESRDHALFMAETIAAASSRAGFPFIFKASSTRPTAPPSIPTGAPAWKEAWKSSRR